MGFHIGIIGSGPAGLTTALALEKATPPGAVQITLMDRNTSLVDYPGVEYGLQERACRALERLGIESKVTDQGHRPDRIKFFNARTRRTQLSVQVNPQYTVNVLRQEFLARYTGLLSRTEVLREHEATRIETLANRRVRVVFKENYAGGPRPIDFDCLIASDGIHSLARRQYFPNMTTCDRGFSALYLLIPAPEDRSRLPRSFQELANGSTVQFSMGTFAVNAFFPQGKDRMTLALGFDHATGAKLWQEHGLDPQTPWIEVAADVKKAIARRLAIDTPIYDDVLSRALDFVPDWDSPTVYRWMMRDSDPLSAPFARDADVMLIGDAAHAFLPTIGMGASLAIEDAERFGTALGSYLAATSFERGSIDEHVFAPFARERYPVWKDLMWRARLAAENWMAVGRRRRFTLSPYLPTWWGSRLVAASEGMLDKAGW